MQFNLQDQMLRAYIDKIFDKYDTDKSGTLDQDELTYFFNDLFQQLGIGTTVTKQQSLEAIKSIDQNSDGNVDKRQLFDAFKKMMSRSQQPQMNASYNHPPPPQNYPSYNNSYNNPYQPVNHNPYNMPNPYMNPPPHYSQCPPHNQYQQGSYYGNQQPNYNPQFNNCPNSYPPNNQYMNNSTGYMGGSTGNRWGRMY